MHLAGPAWLFTVGYHPYKGANARVVEVFLGHSDDGFQPIVLNNVSPQVAFATAGVARKEARTIVHLYDTRAQLGVVLHSRDVVGKEKHLRVAHIGHKAQAVVRVVTLRQYKAWVGYVLLFVVFQSPSLQVCFPRRAERGVGNAKVELHSRVSVVADG